MTREKRRNSPEGQARYEEIKREMRKIPKEIKRLLNDEIDEWLFENFMLLPGCCSSISELQYSVARMVAEALWSKKVDLPEGIDEAAKDWAESHYKDSLSQKVCEDDFKAGVEWRDSQLVLIRDLIKEAKKNPKDALAIITRIGRLLNN